MRFELKVVATVLLFLSVAFSILNAVLFISLSQEHEGDIIRYSRPLVDAIIEGTKVEVPAHILITSERLADRWEEYDLITLYRGMFVYVKKGYSYEKTRQFMVSIFVTEILITLIITATFYILLSKFYSSEKRYRDLLGIILLASAHRMGNFLSSIKLSLETFKKELKDTRGEEKLNKLSRQVGLLEEDFKKNLQILNSILDRSTSLEEVDVLSMVREISFHYKKRYPGKLLYIKTSRNGQFRLKTDRALLNNLIDILIENAFLHSAKEIKIRLRKSKGKVCILITNDIKEGRMSGSGIGLEIADYISKLLKVNIHQNIKNSRFKTLLTL